MADGSVLPPFNLARSTAKKSSGIKPGVMQGKPLPEVKNKYTHIEGSLNTGLTVDRVGYVPDRRKEVFERVSRTLLAHIITADDQAEESVFELADLNSSPTSAAHSHYQASPFANAASTALSPSAASPSRGSVYSFDTKAAHDSESAYASTYASHYQHGKGAASAALDSEAVSHVSLYPSHEQLHHQVSPSKYTKHLGASAKAAAARASAPHEPDFLLCDVRSEEEYNACHIRAAGSFPYSHLRQDRITAALVRIRSDPSKVLILYDDDERLAQQTAELLLGKNYPSVAILTGGLPKFAEKYPELLVGPQQAAYASPPKATRPPRHTHSCIGSSAHSGASSASSAHSNPHSKLTASALAAAAASASPAPLRTAASSIGGASTRAPPSVLGGASIASRRTGVSTAASRVSTQSKSRFVSVGAALAHAHIADVAPPTALQRLREKLAMEAGLVSDEASIMTGASRRTGTGASMRR